MRRSRVLALVLLPALLAAASIQVATATHPSDGDRDPLTMAKAMMTDPDSVVSAGLASDATGTTDHVGVMASTDEMADFPLEHSDEFLTIASGETNLANDANTATGTSSTLEGMSTNQNQDLAGFNIELAIPPGQGEPCFQIDLKLLSEEFPEYVGSAFNDFVTGRINNTAPPEVTDGDEPVAAGNFLHDTNNLALNINNNYNVAVAHAEGTTYDGATPTLLARTRVPEGSSFTVSFYVADVADSIYDTAVFFDNGRVFRSEKCKQGTFGPTVTTVDVELETARKLNVSGTVGPEHDGDDVQVTLFKKVGGAFKKAESKTLTLEDTLAFYGVSVYDTSFQRLTEKTCRVVTKFGSDGDHFASAAKKTFDC